MYIKTVPEVSIYFVTCPKSVKIGQTGEAYVNILIVISTFTTNRWYVSDKVSLTRDGPDTELNVLT